MKAYRCKNEKKAKKGRRVAVKGDGMEGRNVALCTQNSIRETHEMGLLVDIK